MTAAMTMVLGMMTFDGLMMVPTTVVMMLVPTVSDVTAIAGPMMMAGPVLVTWGSGVRGLGATLVRMMMVRMLTLIVAVVDMALVTTTIAVSMTSVTAAASTSSPLASTPGQNGTTRGTPRG